MKLGNTKAICIENDHDGRVRDIDANLDHGGSHEHINIAAAELAHDLFFLG